MKERKTKMKTIQKKRKKAVNRKYTAPKSLAGTDSPLGETFGKPFDGSFNQRPTKHEIEEAFDDLGIALAKRFRIPLD
mgnify:FL=1